MVASTVPHPAGAIADRLSIVISRLGRVANNVALAVSELSEVTEMVEALRHPPPPATPPTLAEFTVEVERRLFRLIGDAAEQAMIHDVIISSFAAGSSPTDAALALRTCFSWGVEGGGL